MRLDRATELPSAGVTTPGRKALSRRVIDASEDSIPSRGPEVRRVHRSTVRVRADTFRGLELGFKNLWVASAFRRKSVSRRPLPAKAGSHEDGFETTSSS
jgi:hypothetical protein